MDLLTYILLQNMKQHEGGTLWRHLKVFEKIGPFGLSLPRPDLALGGFRIIFKKWTDQCEVCGLKKSHCFSRAFFL